MEAATADVRTPDADGHPSGEGIAEEERQEGTRSMTPLAAWLNLIIYPLVAGFLIGVAFSTAAFLYWIVRMTRASSRG